MYRIFRLISPIILGLAVAASLFSPIVMAQEGDPAYQQKLQEIAQLQAKISELQGQAKTLNDALNVISKKKQLIQAQIDATQVQIAILERDIDSLSGKITVLESALDTLTANLLYESVLSYKQGNPDSIELLFSSKDAGDLIASIKSIESAKEHHQILLRKTTEAKLSYDSEKTDKEKKQKTVEALKATLDKQQSDLVAQEQAQKILISQTKNSEATYQKLLAQAQAELASFRAFTSSKGLGVLPEQHSPDGWYYSQRDQRWANMCIGQTCQNKNPDTIIEVGCLISSVAMVKKKYGENVTPMDIAVVNSYFSLNTASMTRPWPAPSGKSWDIRDYFDKGLVDSSISSGKPVIIKLSVHTTVVGTHFIVLKSGSNGDYVMHDPWEGYDKNFKDFYSTSQIIGMGLLKD
ncbi:MAG TPA: hypothetical protein VLH19_03900 [Patescibacteria group bacterium]|nr:hypothetical protein [Patescibacteria group bacterium]